MVPLFPLVITSLMCGGQQWYTQFPVIILTSLLTIFSWKEKNLLHSRHLQTTCYLETCLTTNSVCSAPCLSIVFKQKYQYVSDLCHQFQHPTWSYPPTSPSGCSGNTWCNQSNCTRAVCHSECAHSSCSMPSIYWHYRNAYSWKSHPWTWHATCQILCYSVTHHLTDGVRNKLEENGYSGSHTFQYAQWEELREAGLKAGEIAQLKHAIISWSILWEVWQYKIFYGCLQKLNCVTHRLYGQLWTSQTEPCTNLIAFGWEYKFRSTLHGKNTPLRLWVLWYPSQPGRQTEYHHQVKTGHNCCESMLLS